MAPFQIFMFKNCILLICLVYIVFAVYFLLAYLNVHCSLFNIFVYGHEYAYKTYEYISKLVLLYVFIKKYCPSSAPALIRP